MDPTTPKTLLKTIARTVPPGSLTQDQGPPTSLPYQDSNSHLKHRGVGYQQQMQQEQQQQQQQQQQPASKNPQRKTATTKAPAAKNRQGVGLTWFEIYLIILNVILSTGILLTILGFSLIAYFLSNNVKLESASTADILRLLDTTLQQVLEDALPRIGAMKAQILAIVLQVMETLGL